MRLRAPALLLSGLILGAPALAQPPGPAPMEGPRLGIHLGGEGFRWEETAPGRASRELVEEEGPRASAALTLDNLVRTGEGAIYALKLRGYYGEVDYDGETQAGVPVRTEVDYWGGAFEGRFGYRFPLDWPRWSFDALGGLGGELWSRDIQDAFDRRGNPVRGLREKYLVSYARLGVGLVNHHSDKWFARLAGGMKYPLTVDQEVPAINADPEPGGEISFYAEYEISRAIGDGKQIGLTLFYDSLRLDESPLSSSSIGLVRQPETDMDVVGIQLGLYI